jgi:hypothetical protein
MVRRTAHPHCGHEFVRQSHISLRSENPVINLSNQSRQQFIASFMNRGYDPFKEVYLPHLDRLLEIIKQCVERLEGNIFYIHHELNLNHDFYADFLPKRRALALLSIMNSRIMEIGFNSGFSALLMLVANPDLKLTCIDICHHRYTKPCYEYLRSVFGDRIELIDSNSLTAFPLLARRQIDYDAYIIDGGHGVDVAEADITNVISFGRRGSIICFDDSDYPPIRVLLDMYMLTGKIININDQIGFFDNLKQMFFINNK